MINGYLSILVTFKEKINKVSILGDSAGGNLICSLCNYLIINELKVPNKISLFYPAFAINPKLFTNSSLYSFFDVILNYFYAEKVIREYVPKIFKYDNIFISPFYTPNHILRKYPEILILTGSKDCLIS